MYDIFRSTASARPAGPYAFVMRGRSELLPVDPSGAKWEYVVTVSLDTATRNLTAAVLDELKSVGYGIARGPLLL